MFAVTEKARRNAVVLCNRLMRLFRPPNKITVSQWADEHRYLSSEASAEVGKWRTSRAEYQRGIMDAVTLPEVEEVTVMASSQVGKTEVLLNVAGHFIHHDPSPILMVEPTLDMAMAYSKDRFAPMVRDTPVLKERVVEAKQKSGESTILHKTFRGGHITFVGANAPAGLAGRPIRVLLNDEVDRYPVSAGTEGDAVKLARKRTQTFWNRKVLNVSTPTVRGASRIEALYLASSMGEYHVPCPHCGVFQPLKFAGLKWETVDGHGVPSTARYQCQHCGADIHEVDKLRIIGMGKWVHQHPERMKHQGFHLNELLSPWSTWAKIVEEFLEAKKSPETLRVFINTTLGESWEDAEAKQIDDGELAKRIEEYGDTTLPTGVCVLTCAVDVQDTYLAVHTVGWGIKEEAWVVDFRYITGAPDKPETWEDVDKYLERTWRREDGVELRVLCTTVDTGGHFTDAVYNYTKAHELHRVFSIKGAGGAGQPLVSKFSIRGRVRAKLFNIGVDTGKEIVYTRLGYEKFGPGYVHFRKDVCDNDYFKQLTAEKQVRKFDRGFVRLKWEKVRARNEALDTMVYNLAALRILNPDLEVIAAKQAKAAEQYKGQERGVEESKVEEEATPTPAPEAKPTTKPGPRPRPAGWRAGGKNWVTKW